MINNTCENTRLGGITCAKTNVSRPGSVITRVINSDQTWLGDTTTDQHGDYSRLINDTTDKALMVTKHGSGTLTAANNGDDTQLGHTAGSTSAM